MKKRKKEILELNTSNLVRLLFPRKYEKIFSILSDIRTAAPKGITFTLLAKKHYGHLKNPDSTLSEDLQPFQDIGLVQNRSGTLTLSYAAIKENVKKLDRSLLNFCEEK